MQLVHVAQVARKLKAMLESTMECTPYALSQFDNGRKRARLFTATSAESSRSNKLLLDAISSMREMVLVKKKEIIL